VPSRSRATALTGLIAVLGSLLLLGSAGPAGAAITVNEIYPVPAGGVYDVDGHGWGHGHGMSQYGVQGGAQLGKTADEMTSFYYPGTSKGSMGNPPLRVRLLEDNDNSTEVYPATGLKVADLASGASQTLPSSPSRWRTTVDSAGLHLQQYSSGAWHAWNLGTQAALKGPVQFSGPTFVRVELPPSVGASRDYRGAVTAVQTSSTSSATVDTLPMESYLLGVVPRESSSSWDPAALQAQAIAARSYSEYKRGHVASGAWYDICDTTQCQVFGGSAVWSSSGTRTDLEPTSTTDAVSATAGVIRTSGGTAIFAEFSASNGGWSTDGGFPYLVAQRDDWDGVTGSSVHSWSATVSAAQLEARYPAVGHLQRMRVTQRDGNGEWGGRVLQVVLEGVDSAGSATSVTTTGAGVYNAHTWPAYSDGLRSSWWHIRSSTQATVVAVSRAPSLVQSPGQSTGQLAVQLKNTGTVGWPTSDVHLIGGSPVGSPDPLVGNSAPQGLFTKDLTNPGSSSVDPGDVAEFRFSLTGDGVAPGSYDRAYRLQLGGGALFGPVVSWTVPVAAAVLTGSPAAPPASTSTTAPTGDDPGPVFADGRTVVLPYDGTTVVRLSLTNTGNVTWPVGSTSKVLLGTSVARNRESASAGSDWLSTSRPAALNGTTAVAPGAVGTFDLDLHGNTKYPGTTTEAFESLWEGVRWIQPAPTTLTVVRVNTHLSRLSEVNVPAPRGVTLYNAPNGTATFVVRMRNLGGDPWPVGAEELTTGSPSTVATSAWKDSSHPPALYRNVTRPGITAVYPGEIGEWRIPVSAWRKDVGSYPLSLQASGPAGPYGPTTSTTVVVKQATFTAGTVAVHPSVTIPSGGAVRTWYDVKNTSNVAWPVGQLVRSASLLGKGSPSHASNWLTVSRPGPLTSNLTVPGAKIVAPGQVARFVFYLAGNGRQPGSYSEPFGVVWEGWRFSGLTVTVPYRIS
jgi:SpoIID/LytB domain protein